ncbi:PilZ domain-containing protein [Marinobacterium marinum]|uniref:PilZ domain-containing protein n=1 Tax=Marinobacterium marinum TaxID=2756129 RepID=A0A7W1WY79_9GAMM|nr:PilZ domain-containing protein [Marinobacterium marinum]MBA4502237.1 PilZ domain-containing protein [Marinobacterium marinum]
MLQERRIFPRIHCDVDAELETTDGGLLDVRITSISCSGLYVVGDDELSGLQPPEGVGAAEVWLHFGLEANTLRCHCRIIYKRRNAHDNIGLGLHIISTDETALHAIDHYVTARLF